MAIETSNVNITPSEGWVWIASNPNAIIVRNRDGRPFQVAVLGAPGAPDDSQSMTFSTYSQQDGHYFERLEPSTGEFYLRALVDGPSGEPTRMGLFLDIGSLFTITVDTTAITVDTTVVTSDAT